MSEIISFLQSKTAGSLSIKQSIWLETFAYNAASGILLTDEQLKIIYVNEAFCKLFEIKESAQNFTEKNIAEIFSSANKSLYGNADLAYKSHEAADKKTAQTQELVFSNGKHINIAYQPLLIDNNSTGHVWLYSDESENTELIKKISREKNFYETAFNNFPSAICLFTPGGEYLLANVYEEKNEELRKWMIGKNTGQYLLQADKKNVNIERRDYYFKKVAIEKVPAEWEEMHVDTDGNKNEYLRGLIPVFDEKKELKYILGFEKNINKQKNIQTLLEQSEKKFRNLFTNTQALICTHDMNGSITTANPALCDLFECSADDLAGKNIKDYLSDPETKNFESVYLDQIKKDGRSEGLLKVFKKNKEAVYLLYHNYAVEDEAKPYVVGFAQNITQRILAEKKLRDSQKETEELVKSKERFLAQMSHEIRTPMNGIIGISSLLQKTVLTGEQRFYLNIIEESAQKLLGTINQIQEDSNSDIALKTVDLPFVNKESDTENKKIQSEPISENDFNNQQNEEMVKKSINTPLKNSSQPENALGSLYILLAEDNDINQVLAKNILNHWGFKNKTVSDGEKVLDALEEEDFDIILMDIQMPHKNGIEVTQEIRKLSNDKKRNVPIIALTAFSIRGEEKKYYEAGMDACLTKPFKEKELYDTISKVLEFRKLNPDVYQQVKNKVIPLEENAVKNDLLTNEVNTGFQESKLLYDLSYLRGIQGSSADLVNKLIEIFIRTVPPATKEMTYASKGADWESVSKLAHKVKSSINTMGIHSLKNDIKFVEEMASKKENLEEVISKIITIDNSVSVAAQQLQEELNISVAVLN